MAELVSQEMELVQTYRLPADGIGAAYDNHGQEISELYFPIRAKLGIALPRVAAPHERPVVRLVRSR